MADSALDRSNSGHSSVSGTDAPRKKPTALLYWVGVVVVIALGMLLRSPVLAGARISDDWDHYAMVEGIYPVGRSPFDLYNFIGARQSDRQALLESGRLPWWSDPKIRISFFRPLASVFTYADYAWFGAEAAPERAHLHSLLWWGASLFAVAAVLGSLFTTSTAIVALLLFTVDEGHALPVAWSASRAEVIATALMMWSLWSLIAWSKRGQRRFGVLAFMFTTLAALAGEHALSLFPYVAAFGLFGVDTGLRQRLIRVGLLAIPIVGFLCLHVVKHYGVEGSSFYTDPFGDLASYAAQLPQRVAQLLGDAVCGYSADWSFIAPAWMWWLQEHGVPAAWLTHTKLLTLQTLVGAAAGLMIGVGWIWLGSRRDSAGAPSVRWLLLGAVASLLPLGSAFAMTRLTVAPGFGILACMAVLATRAVSQLRGSTSQVRRFGWGIALLAVTLVHGVLAASRSYAASAMYAAWSSGEEAWVRRAQFDVSSLEDRHVFVLSAHDTVSQYALPFAQHLMRASMPRSSQILLPPALSPLRIERIAENTLEVTASDPDGHFGFLNSAYRRGEANFFPGQHVSNPHFRVEVVSVAHGIPRTLRFIFPRAVDDSANVFVYPGDEGLRRLVLPALGESVLLPPPAVPRLISNEVGR